MWSIFVGSHICWGGAAFVRDQVCLDTSWCKKGQRPALGVKPVLTTHHRLAPFKNGCRPFLHKQSDNQQRDICLAEWSHWSCLQGALYVNCRLCRITCSTCAHWTFSNCYSCLFSSPDWLMSQWAVYCAVHGTDCSFQTNHGDQLWCATH